MNVVAVIPARGGSVGLPRKNIKHLNGISLLERSVFAALGASCISSVYVSSDSREILDVGERCGALSIERPADISGPTASSEAALVHALRAIQDLHGALPDVLVFLQCTSPFTRSEQIDEVVSQLVAKNAESAFSAIEDHSFIWQASSDGSAVGVTHDHTKPRQRRQDMEPRYKENGAIYAMRVASFLEVGRRFCGRTILVPTEMPPIEIDTQADWDVAEAYAVSQEKRCLSEVSRLKIRALVTDFDGVHTNDLVTVSQEGIECVTCSRSDGMGIEMLRKRGLKLLILSREENPVVRARAKKLRMEVLHHVQDKVPVLDEWRKENQLEWSDIAFVGNDINDIECMQRCGVSFCPADAHPLAQSAASYVLTKAGGRGALRELSEHILGKNTLY